MPRLIDHRYARFNTAVDPYVDQVPPQPRREDNTLRNLAVAGLGVGALALGGYGARKWYKRRQAAKAADSAKDAAAPAKAEVMAADSPVQSMPGAGSPPASVAATSSNAATTNPTNTNVANQQQTQQRQPGRIRSRVRSWWNRVTAPRQPRQVAQAPAAEAPALSLNDLIQRNRRTMEFTPQTAPWNQNLQPARQAQQPASRQRQPVPDPWLDEPQLPVRPARRTSVAAPITSQAQRPPQPQPQQAAPAYQNMRGFDEGSPALPMSGVAMAAPAQRMPPNRVAVREPITIDVPAVRVSNTALPQAAPAATRQRPRSPMVAPGRWQPQELLPEAAFPSGRQSGGNWYRPAQTQNIPPAANVDQNYLTPAQQQRLRQSREQQAVERMQAGAVQPWSEEFSPQYAQPLSLRDLRRVPRDPALAMEIRLRRLANRNQTTAPFSAPPRTQFVPFSRSRSRSRR